MRKFFAAMLLIILFSSVSYGAVSQDIYVRQDIFDAKMEALFERLHWDNTMLNDRMDDLFMASYLLPITIVLVVIFSFVKDFFQAREERRKNTPSFTLEDVERLIDSKLSKLSRT